MTSRLILLLALFASTHPGDARGTAAETDHPRDARGTATWPEGEREGGEPTSAGARYEGQPAGSSGQTTAPPTRSVSGVADLRMTTKGSRFSLRLIFAASGESARLRIEVVRAGTLLAVAWYDAERLIIFAPTEGLVHEGSPTRQTLEAALGIPFCPADVLYALRGGLPPAPPPCDAADMEREAMGSGGDGVVELRRGGARPTRLRFARYREVAGRPWPHRVTLESDTAQAIVDMIAIGRGPLAPVPPSADQLSAARRVDAATLSEALGINRIADRGAAAPPEPHQELGR